MADRLISCDDHMDLSQLPADLWTSRLPASLLDRAPHVEERDGQAVWVCDGKVWGRWDGKPPATGSERPVKALYNAFDRAAIYDHSARRPANPKLRLADMDRDGVETQVIFGPIFPISTDDPVLRVACYRVYNDWLLDFCKAAPDRLIGLPMLPETPETALAELECVIAKGNVRQVNLMIANVAPKLDDPAWEPLWQMLEDSGVILSWHITVFVAKPTDRFAGKAASVFENTKGFLANFLEPFVDLFAWGILERHPKLRMVMAEAGTGWLPWLVQSSITVTGGSGKRRNSGPTKVARHSSRSRASSSSGRSTRRFRTITSRCRSSRSSARGTSCGPRTIRIPTASGPTHERRSSGRCVTCRRRCAAS